MRRIASLLLPALAAGTLLLSSACNSKKTELQDIPLGSNQLSAFSISSSEKKVASALERVQFSIRNSTEGQITNPEPLPYGQALDKVRLRITAAAAAAQVEVALGTGNFESWTATKTYDLSSTKDLRIRVSTPVVGTNQREQYVYRVHLSSYVNDPQTFQWSEVSASQLPTLEGGALGLLEQAKGAALLWRSTNANQLTSYASTPTSWSSEPLSGIPNTERVTSIASLGSVRYITTSAAKLYREQSGSWIEVSGTGITRLIGPLTSTQGEPRLAVIKTEGGSQQFGLYDGSQVESRSYSVPSDFPAAGSYSYSSNDKLVGRTTLYLFGSQELAGKHYPTRWWTTNGVQWAQDRDSLSYGARPLYETVTHLASTSESFRFVATATGLEMYFSRDGGQSWERGRDIALTGLTPSDFASKRILALKGADATHIYLLMGGAQPRLFEGLIRRSEHN